MDTFKYVWKVVTQPEQLVYTEHGVWNMSGDGKDALASNRIFQPPGLCCCTLVIPGDSSVQDVTMRIKGESRLPHAGNRESTDAFRPITERNSCLHALE